MLEMRPTSIAYIDAASLRLVVELLGKFVVSNRDVAPVLTGSLVAFPKVAVGKIGEPTVCCQLLIWVKLPPKSSRWEPRAHVRLSAKVVVGVLRRDWPLVRYGFWT